MTLGLIRPGDLVVYVGNKYTRLRDHPLEVVSVWGTSVSVLLPDNLHVNSCSNLAVLGAEVLEEYNQKD